MPIQVDLSTFVPSTANGIPIGTVDLLVFHATRASILELAEVMGQDPKAMLDQLGEG
jgi:hypothetical protein